MQARGVWPWISAFALAVTHAGEARADAACSKEGGAALSQLACEVTAALGGKAQGALVVAAALGTELSPRDPERLTSRLASLVAGALGNGAAFEARPLTLLEARGRASARRSGLVHLNVRLARDKLEVTAELYASPGRFWQRVKNPHPGTSAHAFATRPLDAEVRSYLPPVPLIARRTERFLGSDPDVIALACGDTDGDAASELVVVGRRRISVGRLRAGQFQSLRSVAWNELAEIAPAPWREPVASAWIGRPGTIEIGSTDRAEAVRLDATLGKIASLGRTLPWPGTGQCARIAALSLLPEAGPCSSKGAAAEPASGGDAVAGAEIVLPDGKRRGLRAVRRADRSVTLSDDEGKQVRLELAGAQLAVGDLDGNGVPELLSSIDTLAPGEDALVAHSWGADGKLTEKLRVPVPAGVRAIAICPIEENAMAPIAIGTAEGLWIVR
jgi:hypothetical protein